MELGTHSDSPQDNPANGSASNSSRQRNVLPRSSCPPRSLFQDTRTSNDSSSSSRQSKARSTAERENEFPKEGKIKIRLNKEFQPESPTWAVTKLSNEAASLARRDIRIIYPDFRKVPPDEYGKVIDNLNEHFEFEDWDGGVDCDYVRSKINDAWRRRKYYLKKKYIDGKDPNVVKAMAPPDQVPVEDWRIFIDYCISETMQDLSEQNRENRNLQELPNCSGRTAAQVVRYKIAQELGIDSSEVGRGYTFLAMHTHPDKTPQNVEISMAIQSSMSSNPDSQTSCDDAVTEVLGPDSRGRIRVGGAGICKTQMKKIANIKKKQACEARKNEEWKILMEGKLDEVIGAVEDLTSIIRDMRSVPQSGQHIPQSGQPRGERASSSDTGKMVRVLGGWPTTEYAWGIVKVVDPTHKYCERCLGDGNYLVYITTVLVADAVLPLPHDDYFTTLGQVGQGHVIWPKASLEFIS